MDFTDIYPPAKNASASEANQTGAVASVTRAFHGIRPEYLVIGAILVLIVLRVAWERGK